MVDLLTARSDNWIGLGEAVLALEQGQRFCESKQWSEAIALCQQALSSFEPGAAMAYQTLGWALQEQGELDEAEGFYRKALAIQPENFEVQARLANLYEVKGQWQDAIACYQVMIARDPSFVEVYLKLGVVWQRAGDLVQSILNYHQGAQLKPELLSIADHLMIAQQLVEQGQGAEAIAAYRLVLKLDSQQRIAWVKLAEVLGQQEQFEAAIACYREAIVVQPETAIFYTYLGNLLTQQGRSEEAIALHRRAALLRGWSEAEGHQYRFTHDWFTHNLTFWRLYLASYVGQPQVKFLEIGSYEGMSTCWLLDQVLTDPTAELHSIDINYQACFDSNTTATGSTERLIKRIGSSHEVLPQLAEQYSASYDVIYIDGCHLAEHVRLDAVFSWPLLKPGGLMIFDDYVWKDPNYPDQDPSRGIDEFVNSISGQFELIHQEYQMIIRKCIGSKPS
jgi:tetratricopeptide (TPR) repeat protein